MLRAGFMILVLFCLATAGGFLIWYVKATPIEWIIETVDASANVGADSSIAIDSDGFPHIAYYDSYWQNLKYATPSRVGIGWLIEPVDTPGIIGHHPSIALDTNDRPHISYRDQSNYALKYAQHTSTAWSIETVDSLYGVGRYSSLILDANDHPHISYVEESDVFGRLKYAQWTGSTWSIEFVGTDHYNTDTSLVLDADGYPHISYTSHYEHNYAQWTGSTWSFETIDTETQGYINPSTSLALDSEDRPHISYYDRDNGNLKYAKWNGTLWNIETVDTGDLWRLSLALDANDRPHISYIDDTTEDLKYARWTGSTWAIESVDTEGALGGFISLALDAESRPHISYYDEDNGNLKYASTSDEFYRDVTVTPFDSDSDGQQDAVTIQLNVDTMSVHGEYGGTVPVEVNAFLVDSFGYHADHDVASWAVTGYTVDWQEITLSVPPGYFDGPSMYSLELNLFDTDGFYEDFHHETGLYLYPRSTSAVAFIESCNATAGRQDVFALGEPVYVYGNGFAPSTEYHVYVVVDAELWIDGTPIPERVPGTRLGLASNTEGGISPIDVWTDPQTAGYYDIVVDVNGNGHYDAGVDAVDDADVADAAGVSVIPEFANLLPFFLLTTSLAATILRRKA